MTPSDHIIDVTETDFQYQVLAYSQRTPVVVDFWAEWCAPCKMLSPILEKLAHEAAGAFRLAKVDVDANPNLAMRYNVHGIPVVKFIRSGEVVAEFTGAQPETVVRQYLRSIAPASGDLKIEKAQSLLGRGDWANAAQTFGQALKSSPGESTPLLGLAKSLLAQGKGAEALKRLQDFPASKEYNAAQILHPLAAALAELKDRPQSDDPLEAAFARGLSLVQRGNLPAALDGLLDILRQDKDFQDGAARQMILAILEIMGEDDPLTRQYRRELASVLF